MLACMTWLGALNLPRQSSSVQISPPQMKERDREKATQDNQHSLKKDHDNQAYLGSTHLLQKILEERPSSRLLAPSASASFTLGLRAQVLLGS
ncbi:hypothetical protein BO86DRAFT_236597 [Aspergillus japonicus CBS 114.51]|uniref:Uncharacterized protein n=1 Tax=Aspergillus japonicus CBS 114.51 TaxID=1448312 RepID=A0A8T8WND7_ASPJA|nr:hypothetical protein BO86DRAFT_236597 [Aspergillus japonicus CBS 114.51]RAH76909.1 hypothetical protein BO86DRAFT_236597 [Aspergillus japonicus CBS 114.51]